MKKVDYLIIALIFVFITMIYMFIYRPYISKSSDKIQLIINNEEIDNFYLYEEITYEIKSNNNQILIYKNDSLFKTIDNKNIKSIYNKIKIEDRKVQVIDSNCIHKDCMNMEIKDTNKLPIICTNGITIKYKTKSNNTSDIII